jgi:hypothetical protein
MAFDNTVQPNSSFADNGGGNFVSNDTNTFLFEADGFGNGYGGDGFGLRQQGDEEWFNAMGWWKTTWMSTFQPNKYKEKRDKEVQDGLVKQYSLNDGASCSKINSTIDKMEARLGKEANDDPGGRGGRRMQGRILKGIEAPLNKGYNLAEEKCCEFSVCDSNKDRGRDTGDDTGDDGGNGGGTSGSGSGGSGSGGGNSPMDDAFKLQLLAALQQRSAPEETEESSTAMKIGLGIGAVVILGGMGYLIFGK